jgi:hypothetical protein
MSDIVAPASRNSPCPCGSGRRYKECHGLIGSTASATPQSPRQSSYRAPGNEWAHLDEAGRDALGTRMERALAKQMAGEVDKAAREYRVVIAAAPATHDALHMLGVIELGRGNLDLAEQLIAQALPLRAPYPALEHNRQLVQEARLARLRAQPDQLAERALPILFELALAPSAASSQRRRRSISDATVAVHIIGRMHAGDHDDGWMLRRLVDLLDSPALAVWAADGESTQRVGAHRVRRIDANTGAVPAGGTLVFVGVDFECASWIARTDAERVIVIGQPTAPTRSLEQLRAIAHDGARAVELVFTSHAVAQRFGAGHLVLPPPIELAEWLQLSALEQGATADAWPVGIVGQQQYAPREPSDADFVTTIEHIAGELHIYDPGRFRFTLGGSPSTHCFARTNGGLAPFLAGVRCFVHRTNEWWQDSLGREVYGAMALGIPVLCPRGSVHAERIAHGVDGFLYDSTAEAQQLLTELRRTPDLAQKVGAAGRDTMRTLLDPDALARQYRECVFGAQASIMEAHR